ncbi:hypothetical protein [Pseudobacteroides cellulosolvens]|uniref:Uncharacterized protein n=1 Tax=Pseudobacteroides cellulosolvens ATCC 35603 = DSM 2933 TaxID=398512 RepID=A0A0L6JHY6_9FIRM|nr:hypothetical protein [Pseudobacteroides cellulosolvens]KNY25323.1 hypothetical protein Bccel_0583 [Pseudobacteroides cellulosolvens ATCC 35603 = DSM 2933]
MFIASRNNNFINSIIPKYLYNEENYLGYVLLFFRHNQVKFKKDISTPIKFVKNSQVFITRPNNINKLFHNYFTNRSMIFNSKYKSCSLPLKSSEGREKGYKSELFNDMALNIYRYLKILHTNKEYLQKVKQRVDNTSFTLEEEQRVYKQKWLEKLEEIHKAQLTYQSSEELGSKFYKNNRLKEHRWESTESNILFNRNIEKYEVQILEKNSIEKMICQRILNSTVRSLEITSSLIGSEYNKELKEIKEQKWEQIKIRLNKLFIRNLIQTEALRIVSSGIEKKIYEIPLYSLMRSLDTTWSIKIDEHSRAQMKMTLDIYKHLKVFCSSKELTQEINKKDNILSLVTEEKQLGWKQKWLGKLEEIHIANLTYQSSEVLGSKFYTLNRLKEHRWESIESNILFNRNVEKYEVQRLGKNSLEKIIYKSILLSEVRTLKFTSSLIRNQYIKEQLKTALIIYRHVKAVDNNKQFMQEETALEITEQRYKVLKNLFYKYHHEKGHKWDQIETRLNKLFNKNLLKIESQTLTNTNIEKRNYESLLNSLARNLETICSIKANEYINLTCKSLEVLGYKFYKINRLKEHRWEDIEHSLNILLSRNIERDEVQRLEKDNIENRIYKNLLYCAVRTLEITSSLIRSQYSKEQLKTAFIIYRHLKALNNNKKLIQEVKKKDNKLSLAIDVEQREWNQKWLGKLEEKYLYDLTYQRSEVLEKKLYKLKHLQEKKWEQIEVRLNKLLNRNLIKTESQRLISRNNEKRIYESVLVRLARNLETICSIKTNEYSKAQQKRVLNIYKHLKASYINEKLTQEINKIDNKLSLVLEEKKLERKQKWIGKLEEIHNINLTYKSLEVLGCKFYKINRLKEHRWEDIEHSLNVLFSRNIERDEVQRLEKDNIENRIYKNLLYCAVRTLEITRSLIRNQYSKEQFRTAFVIYRHLKALNNNKELIQEVKKKNNKLSLAIDEEQREWNQYEQNQWKLDGKEHNWDQIETNLNKLFNKNLLKTESQTLTNSNIKTRIYESMLNCLVRNLETICSIKANGYSKAAQLKRVLNIYKHLKAFYSSEELNKINNKLRLVLEEEKWECKQKWLGKLEEIHEVDLTCQRSEVLENKLYKVKNLKEKKSEKFDTRLNKLFISSLIHTVAQRIVGSYIEKSIAKTPLISEVKNLKIIDSTRRHEYSTIQLMEQPKKYIQQAALYKSKGFLNSVIRKWYEERHLVSRIYKKQEQEPALITYKNSIKIHGINRNIVETNGISTTEIIHKAVMEYKKQISSNVNVEKNIEKKVEHIKENNNDMEIRKLTKQQVDSIADELIRKIERKLKFDRQRMGYT